MDTKKRNTHTHTHTHDPISFHQTQTQKQTKTKKNKKQKAITQDALSHEYSPVVTGMGVESPLHSRIGIVRNLRKVFVESKLERMAKKEGE